MPTIEMQVEKTLYKATDLIVRWSLSRSMIYQLMDSGRVPSVKIGRSRRVTRETVERFESELNGMN